MQSRARFSAASTFAVVGLLGLAGLQDVGSAAAEGSAPASPLQAALEHRVDGLFARWDRIDSPGCAIAVVRDGRVVHRRGFGAAHLEYRAPIEADTVFDIGSLSKQFTAVTVAILARRGRLSLDDDVREWVPELPDYGASLTVRHLIHHTSGIRDYFTLWSLMGRDIDDPMPVREVLSLISRQRDLDFAPGADHQYSNSNYFLLARVAEAATGQSLREVARETIFGPLGMDATDFYDDVREVRPRRAEGYSEVGSGFGRRVLRSTIVGDGGVYTTVGDLARWDAGLYGDLLDGPGLAARITTPGRLTDGEVRPYAFGLRLQSYRGLDTLGHGGTMGGYRSYMVRFPVERFTAIVLCNQLEISPYQLSHRIADIYLGERMAPRDGPVPEPFLRNRPESAVDPGPALTPAELQAFAGTYRSDEIETAYELVPRDGRLSLVRRFESDLPVIARGEGRFELAGMPMAFERDADGEIVGLTLRAGRVRRLAFVRE